MTKRAFVCRVKPHGADLVDQALAENRIYSGLHRTPDLLNPEHTKESIELTIKTEHPKERNYPPKPEAEMFWIFSRTMQEGDLVLVATRKKDKTIYFIGRVAGDAYHAPEHYESRTTYRRPVRWLNNKVPVGIRELSSPLYQHMNYVTRVQKSFLDISEFAEEIALLVDRTRTTVRLSMRPTTLFLTMNSSMISRPGWQSLWLIAQGNVYAGSKQPQERLTSGQCSAMNTCATMTSLPRRFFGPTEFAANAGIGPRSIADPVHHTLKFTTLCSLLIKARTS